MDRNMFKVSLAMPTGIFFIIEKIYSGDSFVPDILSLGKIKPSVFQVYRTVISLTVEKDMYMDGEKLVPGNISLWNTVKYAFGTPVSTRNTGRLLYGREFSGFIVAIRPLPPSDVFNMPEKLSAPKIVQLPSAITIGRDPIPDVILYGRHDVKFTMGNGGLDTPTAAAKYNSKTKELHLINDSSSISKLMTDVLGSGIPL